MEMSLFIALIVYAVFVGFFLILAILNFYHIIRFGFINPLSVTVTLIFLLTSVGIILLTFTLLGDVNWNQSARFTLPFTAPFNEELR